MNEDLLSLLRHYHKAPQWYVHYPSWSFQWHSFPEEKKSLGGEMFEEETNFQSDFNEIGVEFHLRCAFDIFVMMIPDDLIFIG